MRQLIYLHGFNSAPQSLKARQLQAALAALNQADRLVVPKLPADPKGVVSLVQSLAVQYEEVAFIGSSLGGYYAAWLADRQDSPCVLINPAMRPYDLLAPYLGRQQNLYTGETYDLTPGMLDTLRRFELRELRSPQRYLLLVQTGDEVLDWQEAATTFRTAQRIIIKGGNHAFENFTNYLPQILQFVDTA